MSRAVIERYWAAQDPYDAAALASLRHRTWSADWPQSAERIPSHEADAAIHGNYAGYPGHGLERVGGSDEVWKPILAPLMFIPVRLSGASDIWIAEVRLEYPDGGLWYGVAAIELRDGLVGQETVYYCQTASSPPWPATYPDEAPVPHPPISASMEHNSEAERRHRESHQRYHDLLASDPAAATDAFFHASAVVDRPQFGRRATGVADITRAQDEQRALLPGRIRRVVGSGHVLLTETRVIHHGDPWFLVTVHEFDGDKVARSVEYLAETYQSPEWRSTWVEPLPPDG